MAGTFQTVSAGFGLAGDIINLISYLKDVKEALETVEDDIDDLIKELEASDNLYRQLEKEYDQHFHQRTLSTRQQELWSLLRQTLQDGRASFEKLDKELKRVYGSDPKVQGWLDALKKQHRLRSRTPRLGAFRDQIHTYNSVLQMWLTRIALSNQDSTRDFERDTWSQLRSLNDGIRNIHDRIEESEQMWFEKDNAFDAIAYQTFTRASINALDKVRASLEQHQQANINKYFDIPQPVDSCYVGREQEAQILASCLLSHARGRLQQQRRFVIHGVGGSGKTQFCCKFAQDHQQWFWGVFWIDGRSHDQLRQTLSQNVAKLGRVDANHKAALNWLSNQEERWLLIIDNADDPGIELKDYLPKGGRGYVLITTRNPGYQPLGNVEPGFFKFHGMKDEDASTLLLRTAGFYPSSDEVTAFATKIVETLGYLALAIAVAGSAIREGYCRFQNYLRYFEDMWETRRRSQTRDRTMVLDDFDERRSTRVEATFDISYMAIAKKNTRASQDALQLLKTFAFLHCENVRFEFLKCCIEGAEKEEEQQSADKETAAKSRSHLPPKTWSQWSIGLWIRILTALRKTQASGILPDVLRDGRKRRVLDENRIRKAMQQLTQYSLTTYNAKTDSWSMHPLVHRWAQELLGMRVGEQYLWCEAAATLICNCVYIGQEDEELLRHLLPHVDEVRREQAMIEKRIKDNRMARIKPWPIFETSFSPQRALMLAKFGIIYAQNGRWKDAEILQSVVQRFTVDVLGFEHLSTRRITMALANTFFHLGRSDDSARLLEKLVDACTIYCGPDHRETLVAKHRLGESRWLQGRVAEAKELYEMSLAGLQRFHGLRDEDTLTVMDSLGGATLLSAHDEAISKARSLHQFTFDTRRSLYGDENLKTLASRELLCSAATWRSDQQELLEAEKGMNDIIRIRKQKLGREHALTLWAMLNLARVKVALQDFEAADELLSEGIPVAERNHGKNHMAVLFCRFHLGRLRAKQRRWTDARNILIDVTERQKVCLQGWGRFHFDRIGGLLELARVHNVLGEHVECDEVVAEIFRGFEKIRTLEHPWARRLRVEAAEWKRQRVFTAST